MNEEWEDYDLITECKNCGEHKPCILEKDPFISEVYPETINSKQFWCKQCWTERKDDI